LVALAHSVLKPISVVVIALTGNGHMRLYPDQERDNIIKSCQQAYNVETPKLNECYVLTTAATKLLVP
jgi:hypothetical protein